jgi:hypothetical protein
MRKRVDIDSQHSRAIVKKIRERLRESLKEDRELPANFRKQIERLRQSEKRGAGQVESGAAKNHPEKPAGQRK